MRELKDVIHFYLGCELSVEESNPYAYALGYTVGLRFAFEPQHLILITAGNIKVKPILRKLSSMTEEEAREIWDSSMERTGYKYNHRDRLLASCNRIEVIAPVLPKLLSKGFDLFGLIDSGLAIELKTEV